MPKKKQSSVKIYPEILTMDETRSLLRVSYNTALELITSKKISGKKIGTNWKILKASVIEYLKSDQVEGNV